MRRDVLLLLSIIIVGYSLFGGLYLAGTAVHGKLATTDGGDELETGRATGAEPDGGLARPFQFEPVDAGFQYEYAARAPKGHMRTLSNAGVYAGDYDDDGWTDLLAVGGENPVLFENTGGSFEPSGALPSIERPVRSATFLDYNRDGRVDILLLADGSEPLLLENVEGRYEKRDAFDRPLAVPYGATVADYNADGCPDVFVYQNGDWSERVPVGFENYSVAVGEGNGNPNYLYRGTCSGFERVSLGGRERNRWSLAASFVDLTGDGRPDIHVANDINHDVLYVNQGDGEFRAKDLPERTNRNGMSSEVADFTRDGRLDVFVTNIYYPEWAAEEINSGLVLKARGNNFISNHGNGTFVMRAEQYNINRGGWGWAAVAADFDNDGDEDLFHTTRRVDFDRRDVLFSDRQLERLNEMAFYRYPAVWARDGLSFTGVSANQSGFEAMNGRGVARLDFDNDGDLDLAVATIDGYQFYENRADSGSSLQVRVLGTEGATAYGATVTVIARNETQRRRVHARTDFLSQDSRLAHVGLGNATRADVRVTWPDGTVRTVEGVATGQRLVVRPGEPVRRRSLDGTAD